MCLGIPGKIIKIWQDKESKVSMASVDFGGIKRDICLAFTPQVKINEYVMSHVGFAISVIDAKEAQKTLKIFRTQEKIEKGID